MPNFQDIRAKLQAIFQRRRLAKIAGYGALVFVALIVNFYLTFPKEALAQRVAHELRKRLGGSYHIEIQEISLYRLTGFSAHNVRIVKNTLTPEGRLDVTLDEVNGRLRLLPLLLARLSINANASLGEGDISAQITRLNDESFEIAAEFDNVDFAKPPLLPQWMGVPMAGKLNGKLETTWNKVDMKKTAGKSSLTITDAGIGPGAVAGFTIPSVGLGTLDLALLIENGNARLASFKQTGGQLRLELSGTSTLHAEFRSSSLNLCVQLKPEQSFLDANPNIKAAVQLAEVTLRKDARGFMHVPLAGIVQKPRFRGGLCREGKS